MKILAALDLTTTTPSVLREARLWARRLQGELFLIHVTAPDPDFVGYGPARKASAWRSPTSSPRRTSRSRDMASDLRKDDVEATALLLQGPTAETILREANASLWTSS